MLVKIETTLYIEADTAKGALEEYYDVIEHAIRNYDAFKGHFVNSFEHEEQE